MGPATCHEFYGVAKTFVLLLSSFPFLYSCDSPAPKSLHFLLFFCLLAPDGLIQLPAVDGRLYGLCCSLPHVFLIASCWCWPGRLFLQLVANFDCIRFSPPAPVSAGTGRDTISSQARGRWQRHMAVNSRIKCLDDDSRWPSLECVGCYGGRLCQILRRFCLKVCGAARLLRFIDSPTDRQ